MLSSNKSMFLVEVVVIAGLDPAKFVIDEGGPPPSALAWIGSHTLCLTYSLIN